MNIKMMGCTYNARPGRGIVVSRSTTFLSGCTGTASRKAGTASGYTRIQSDCNGIEFGYTGAMIEMYANCVTVGMVRKYAGDVSFRAYTGGDMIRTVRTGARSDIGIDIVGVHDNTVG